MFFILAGLAVIPYPGIQNDEALFAAGIYAPLSVHSVQVFHRPVAMMLMSYLGTLKAWLYTPIFALWNPSVYSLRVPVLLLGAVTIWLFYLLILQIMDRRAAVAGCALLATDPAYLYTTCFDWGPVVLQHLLGVGGALLLVRFHRTSSRLALGAGFFLFGLALWDKALFGWTLIGMTVALVCTCPGAIRRAFTLKNLLVAALCFSAGAFPLLRFNARNHWETLRANVGWSADPQVLRGKSLMLRTTLDSGGLLGYLSFEDSAEGGRAPQTALEKASVWLDNSTGRLRYGWLSYAALAALLLLPFVWGTPARRPMIFSLIVVAVVWGQMLFGVNVGASVHHLVLLWPWPHLFIAAAFAGFSSRLKRFGVPALAIVVALLCGRSVLASNVQFSQLIRNGGSLSWTDAIHSLSSYLPTVPAQHYVILDWGMTEPLRLLHANHLPIEWGTDLIMKEYMNDEDKRRFLALIEAPDSLFISHTNSDEVFAGVNERRDRALDAMGYRREVLRVVQDSHGRAAFEVFRAVKRSM